MTAKALVGQVKLYTPGGDDGSVPAFHGAKYWTQDPSATFTPGAGNAIPFGATGLTYDVLLYDTDGYATSGGGFTVPSAQLEGLYRVAAQNVVSGGTTGFLYDGANVDTAVQVGNVDGPNATIYLREGVAYKFFSGGGAIGFAWFEITYVCPLPDSWTAP